MLDNCRNREPLCCFILHHLADQYASLSLPRDVLNMPLLPHHSIRVQEGEREKGRDDLHIWFRALWGYKIDGLAVARSGNRKERRSRWMVDEEKMDWEWQRVRQMLAIAPLLFAPTLVPSLVRSGLWSGLVLIKLCPRFPLPPGLTPGWDLRPATASRA